MKTLDISEATASLAEYARQVGREPVIVTLNGEPVAAVVSVANADWETLRLSTDPEFIALIERSRARQKTQGGLSAAELRERLERDEPPDSASRQ